LKKPRGGDSPDAIPRKSIKIPEDNQNIRPKDNDDREKGASVEGHVEEEFGLFQTEEPLKKDQMAGAADRQKLGHPLNHTEYN
jgi:hypothetical protein